MIWSSEKLSEALGVKVSPVIITGAIQFNSLDVKPGDLFIALKGNNGDGHTYVQDALDKGAAAVIVSRNHCASQARGDVVIQVPDTIKALWSLARYKRQHSKAKFIAITGSVGKTSTKEIIKLMLQPFGKVFAGRGNFNNDLGVHINLASMPDDTEFVVMELGMNHAGEIKELTALVKPDIAIITVISEAHLEFFNSLDNIADAKCEIFEGLSSNGIALINRDTRCFERIIDHLHRLQIKNIHAFSTDLPSDCKLELYHLYDNKVDLAYRLGPNIINLTLPILPKHQAQNFAIGFMVAKSLDLDINKAKSGLTLFELTQGRGQIINVTKGAKKYQALCDYYNASPESMKASLEYLKQIDHPRKVVIIGDMLELGQDAPALHKDIAPYIIDANVTKAFLVGENVRSIEEQIHLKILTKRFADINELLKNLENLLGDEEFILIKGSRGINLEKVLEYFDH